MSEPRFTTYFGMTITPQPGGDVEVRMPAGPQLRNGRGVVHGGVLAALLDTALGAAVVAAIPKEWWCATISLSVEFIAGARGEMLTARGRVLRRGGSTAFAAGEIRDDEGKLIATAQGSWHLWRHHPDARRARADHHLVMRGSGERISVGKILAVGRNYGEHIKEMGGAPQAGVSASSAGAGAGGGTGDVSGAGSRASAAAPSGAVHAEVRGTPHQTHPVLFLKPASALVGDGGAVRIPAGIGAVHHEVELVAVIGKQGRAILESEALEHVLGYAVGLDMTLRDVQSQAKTRGEPWALAKGFDTSAPVSLVAPRLEVGDGSGLQLSLDVNGQRRQDASTSAMLGSVATLVAFASRLMTLEPGDLIFTGTPAGVGPVVPGDLLEARLEKVGTLTVRIEEEPS